MICLIVSNKIHICIDYLCFLISNMRCLVSLLATSDLHQLLQPFLLRRIKEQVLKDLPKKSEVILFHGLSTVQKKIYKAILTKDLSKYESVFNN